MVREWETNPQAASQVEAAWAVGWAQEQGAARAAAEAEKAAERAAAEAADRQEPGVVVKATQAAAAFAVSAVSIELEQEIAEVERSWQRARIEALACTCAPLPEAGSTDRSRISSLAG
jgi:hypothetical protein